MLKIENTSQFKKDYRRAVKQGRDMTRLREALLLLASQSPLPESMCDHSLEGKYKGHRECHLEPDWLLIYKVDEGRLILIATRLGSHSEIFKK